MRINIDTAMRPIRQELSNMPYRKILVPHDCSKISSSAVTHAKYREHIRDSLSHIYSKDLYVHMRPGRQSVLPFI